MSHYVYLITEIPFDDESTQDWVKIGYSKNPPEWRMNANLKRGNPRELDIKRAFEYKNEQLARSAEKLAHEYFSKYANPNGKEWFKIKWQKVDRWFVKNGASVRTDIPTKKTRPKHDKQ